MKPKIDTSVDRLFGVYKRKLRKQIKEITGDFVSEIHALKRTSITYYSDGRTTFGCGVKTWELNRKTGKVRYLSHHDSDEDVTVSVEPGMVYIQYSIFLNTARSIRITVHPSEYI